MYVRIWARPTKSVYFSMLASTQKLSEAPRFDQNKKQKSQALIDLPPRRPVRINVRIPGRGPQTFGGPGRPPRSPPLRVGPAVEATKSLLTRRCPGSVVLCSWSYMVPLILAIHFGIKIRAGTFVIFVSLKRKNV